MVTLPEQLRLVVLAMLPGPLGGLRPMGSFASSCRLWGQCRRRDALMWEENNKHVMFAANGFKSASDVVWRQTAASEAAVQH
eukprot:6597903-Pyramimonas_sp.AAC.1